MLTTREVYEQAAKTDPYLDPGLRGSIVNIARKEFWKVASYYEFDDLVADGYLCYYKCRKNLHARLRVAHPTKDQRKEVQAFVTRAFYNHISTLASKRMGVHEQPVSALVGETETATQFWDKLVQQPEQASMLALVTNAPAEIKQLVTLLVSDGLDLLKFDRKRVGRRSLRETNNEFYCRILGKDPTTTDMVGQLRQYFG